MSSVDIQSAVERLSEALVFADASDLSALAQIHTQFTDIALWAKQEGRERSAAMALAAAALLEMVILQEVPDAGVALLTIGKTATALQQVGQGRPDNEVEFPEELDSQSAVQAASVSGENQYNVKLPANVDESIFGEFLSRQESSLEEMEAILLSFEHNQDSNDVAALKRYLHTLKGESALLGLTEIERLCHVAEDGLSGSISPNMMDTLLGLKDWLKRTFDAYMGKGNPPEPMDKLLEQLKAISGGQGLTAAAPAKPEEPEAPFAEAKMLEGDKELLGDFVLEAMEHLENSDLHLLTLETDPSNADAINAVFRAFHTIKGVAGFLALDEIQALAHEAENLLDHARKGGLQLTGPNIDVVFEAVDVLKRCVENVRKALASGEPLDPVSDVPSLVKRLKRAAAGELVGALTPGSASGPAKLGELLVESGVATELAVTEALARQKESAAPKKVGTLLREANVTSGKQINTALEIQRNEMPEKKLGEILVEMGAASKEDVDNVLTTQDQPASGPRLGEILVQSGESDARDVVQALRAQRGQALGNAATVQVREAVKVDATRLDQLVDMIGELVIAESMVAQSPELRDNLSTDLARHISLLDKITRELQVMAMSLRMVPIRSTFQKMARLVRDLAKKTDKAVEFHTSGEETELDKTVVDRIGDPLVHMVRNAVDHGIEDSEEARKKAGKPATGNVYLRAFHAGGNIHVQIEDDGAGLKREAILKKAIERGIIRPEDNLSDREVWNLVFEPGFSTAEQITAVSGRGVGMDVVKRNIEALRGQVDIKSERGKGTVFTIRLPLTLAIIDGMAIRVGQERYVLPTLSIVISLRPSKADITTVVGSGELLSLHGRLLPLFRLHRLFNIKGAVENPEDGTIVVVENSGQQIGLLIDEILGQQQIVIKSLGEALKGTPGLAGGAIMPDGRVGLILDIGGLVKLATDEHGVS